tara:strand:+ start:273 stop:449 length:177 start_codon:yes stop_codon:yes gene_type:complete
MIWFLILIPMIAYFLMILNVAVMVTVGINVEDIDTIVIWIVWMQVVLFGYIIRRIKQI